MIKVDEFKFVEILIKAMSERANEAFIRDVPILEDATIKNYLQKIIQGNLLELDDKGCENLRAVVNFCFDAD